MTLEEALRFIDPETDMDALAEVEYYGGFKGKERAAYLVRTTSPSTRLSSAPMPTARPTKCRACAKLVQTT